MVVGDEIPRWGAIGVDTCCDFRSRTTKGTSFCEGSNMDIRLRTALWGLR